MPWPEGTATEASDAEAASDEASTATATPQAEAGRSDDWRVNADTVEMEAVFDELDTIAAPELEAFRAKLEIERNISTVIAAVDLSRAYLAASDTAEDLNVLAGFLPRVIRQAAVEAEWRHAEKALAMLKECRIEEWSIQRLAEEVCQPAVLTQTVNSLESLEGYRIDELIAFAGELEEWTIDLLGLVLAEADHSRHEGRLIDAIAAECRDCPERLAPWLADPRPTVVRKTVRILGKIGGDPIAGLLQSVAQHDDATVRAEAVKAVAGVTPRLAKPILIPFLDEADTPTFCSIVQRLGQLRDPEVAELMVGYLTHHEFEKQPIEERRAIGSAVATSGSDEVLPTLEAELHRNLDGAQEAHRQLVASCISQIGTPNAKQVLERGARSGRAALRKTCRDTLARFGRS